MAEAPALISVPAAPSGAVAGGTGYVGPTTAGVAPNPLSSNVRQRKAAVTKELTMMKLRLRTAEDKIATLRLTIVELQARDEESKREREDQALRLETIEAQAQHPQATFYTYLKSQGLQMDNLGSANSISELYMGKVDPMSAEENSKVTDVINKSLASLYGVKKFRPKEHGAYPTVSKSHLEWPSRTEAGVWVTLHCFKWDKPYNSPLNQPTPLGLTRKYPQPESDELSVCQALKQQVTWYHGEKKPKIAGIKRRGEGLDAPEHNANLDSKVEHPFGDLANDGLGYQLNNNNGSHDAPVMNPALFASSTLGDSVVPQIGDPGNSTATTVHNASEDTRSAILQAHTMNSKNNMQSRKGTKPTTCKKQQKGLTGADAKFKESKYNSYETIGAMSKDERIDSIDKDGEMVSTFILHAYNFLSQEKVTQQRGSTRPGPPPKASKAKGALRLWMIKPNVLRANPQWLSKGWVCKSSPEWGKPNGEESTSQKSKKPKLETNPDLHYAQETQGRWIDAKQCYDNWKTSQLAVNNPGAGGSDQL